MAPAVAQTMDIHVATMAFCGNMATDITIDSGDSIGYTHINKAPSNSLGLGHPHGSASLLLMCTALFLHLSHFSKANSFVVVALETALCHSVYVFAQASSYTKSTHCNESLAWFKACGF